MESQGQWKREITELNMQFLRIACDAMSDDMALAAEELGFVGHEEKISILLGLDSEQQMELARADVLFGGGLGDAGVLDDQLQHAVRNGPTDTYYSLITDSRGRPLRPWQQERRLFDLVAWLAIRSHMQARAGVAKTIYRINSPMDISRIRRLQNAGVQRLVMWGGNAKFRISDSLILMLTMMANGIDSDLLHVAAGCMQTTSRHVDNTLI